MHTLREKIHLPLETCLMSVAAVVLSAFVGWFIWVRSGNGITTVMSVLMILMFCTMIPKVKNIP